MIYYKFLDSGGVGPFSGQPWSTEWTEAEDPVPCVRGFHVCRLEDLPYWLHQELWRVNVSGQIDVMGHKAVARRARLSTRVDGWTPDRAHRFAVACVGRVAEHASRECGDLDDGTLAVLGRELIGAEDDALLERLTLAARERQDSATRQGHTQAAAVCGYAADAAEMIGVYPVVASAYVAARAAAATTGGNDDAYEAERTWQALWLEEKLGLED